MKKANLSSLQLYRCFACGYCKFTSDFVDYNCPSYKRFRFETYFTGGRLWLMYAWLNGEISWSENLANIIYTCTTCKNCVEHCPMGFNQDIVNWITSVRGEVIERGLAPPNIRDFLENIRKHGNPWGKPKDGREAWTKNVSVRKFKPADDYLLYVGCLASYDNRAQEIAKSLVEILNDTDISFGILGNEENCDGNEVFMLGEKGLYQLLAEQNIKKFKELNVKRIITLSPHSYNIMRNEYPKLGGTFEVLHYTQLLHDLIKSGKIKLSKTEVKVTYHDPCFLGRYNWIYETPREILRSIPGLELLEMRRNRGNSFCCGGGSGNFIMDLLGGSEDSPNRVRVREAYETGAKVLAVACPGCMVMFESALKDEEMEEKLVVRDISEIIRDSCRK